MISFTAFFDFVLNESDPKHIDFNRAVALLKGEESSTPHFRFYNSEQVFEHVFEIYESGFLKAPMFGRRVEELKNMVVTATGPYRTLSKSKIKKEVEQKIIRDRHATKEQMKKNFLME